MSAILQAAYRRFKKITSKVGYLAYKVLYLVPLWWCLLREAPGRRRLMIKAGLRPDACADDGRTALHLAAGEGASRVAAKLVELGADVKLADRQGRNALDIARAAGYYDLEARLRLLSET